jgi:uncharacterized protein (DUF1697 family)
MRWVALLRGVNVGSTRKLPMAQLCEECAELGWEDIATYIQSGNVLFCAAGQAEVLEAQLEERIGRRFGLSIPVIVRSAAQWAGYSPANPFAEAAEAEPNRLMMMLSKEPPAPGAEQALGERARDGERIALAAGAVWIHYPQGSGTSRLSPSLIDRLIGSPATARNWRTVIKIEEMLGA